MSASEHKDTAPGGPFGVHILTVSSTRSAAGDTGGDAAQRLFEAEGHTVLGRRLVRDDKTAIQRAVRELASDAACQVVFITGGTGISAKDVTPEAVAPLYTKPIPGFGELFRLVSYRDIGTAAMFSRASAGLVGPAVVFATPGSPAAVELAIEELILPELGHFVREVRKEAAVPEAPRGQAAVEAAEVDGGLEVVEAEPVEEEEEAEDEGPKLPPPEPRWRLGVHRGVTAEAEPIVAEPPTDAEGEEVPDRGWKRAVYDLEAEILRGKTPDLPFAIEDLAPVMDVLHQAGESSVLKLPNGNLFTIYGFPDLQRPSSKVIAVGWGEPLAEVIALHRYPVQAGLSIEEERGIMPGRNADIAQVAEAVTGRAPPDTSGELFAVDHDAVYIQRGKWVFRWDGRRERQEGNAKQALATLMIGWHAR